MVAEIPARLPLPMFPAALASVLLLSIAGPASAQFSDYQEDPVTNGEIWIVDGQQLQIQGTFITGRAVFAVHVFVPFVPNENEHEAFAASVARYSVERGYLANALRLNAYSDDYEVFSDFVGVALAYRSPGRETFSGFRFAFDMPELYPDGGPNPLPEIRGPDGFGDDERRDLRELISAAFRDHDYVPVFELLAPDAARVRDTPETRARLTNLWDGVHSLSVTGDGYLIYRGVDQFRRIFTYFIPADIVLNVRPDTVFREHVQVMVVEEYGGYGIYQVDLNFSTQETFDLFNPIGTTTR
jgi:hypothetical protein